MNQSQVQDPRFWRKWALSGALGTFERRVSALVSESKLRRNCRREGIDFSQVCVILPRWAQSAPRSKGVKSALVRCDLIVRSDGSAVFLDGQMGLDSMDLAWNHTQGEANPENLEWDNYVTSITELPEVAKQSFLENPAESVSDLHRHDAKRMKLGASSPLLKLTPITPADVGKVFVVSPDGQSARIMTNDEFFQLGVDEFDTWSDIGEFDVNE